MKYSKISVAIAAAAAVSIVYQTAAAAAFDKPRYKDWILYDDVSITGQFVELLGDRPTKFQEYRDVVSGPQGQNEILLIGSPNSSIYAYFEGFDLFRRDQSVFVELGKPGAYKASFEFNQIPHRYSRSARTIEQDPSTGNYTVDNGTRAALQGMSAAAQATEIRRLAPGFTERDIDIERNRYNWNLSSWLNKALQVEVKAGYETRDGLRKKGTGTYMRTGDLFEIRGIELPEPVRYETLDLGARLTYAVAKSVTSLDWALSYFHNSVDALIWDNPFRITDSAASGTGGTNRGNFARGRVGLYPDNIANTVTLSQAWTLPYETNFTGAVSYGIYYQNDSFLPYTTNSALNTRAGFTVDDTEHLPQKGLKGIASVFSQNFTVINRLIDHLKAKLYMNMYDYINSTDPITFPGYAAYGDSFWLTQITGDSITNHPPSFLDLKTGIELDYEITRNVSWNTGYRYGYRQLKNRQVPDISENTFKNGIEIKPWSFVKLEGSYSFGWRDFDGDYYYHREFSDLRMFDQSNKKSNQVDARVEVTSGERLTVGVSGMWLRDDYKTGYGLKRHAGTNLSIDTEYTSTDNWSFYTYYSYDKGAFDIVSIAKSGTPFNTSNTWFSDTREYTNSLGAGIKHSFIPDRASVDLSYSFSMALQKIVNSNLVPNPANPLTATAHEWPAVRSNLHEFKAQVKYKIHRNLDFRVYYNVELYDLDDFAWDGLQPYMQGLTADNSTQYLWLDSRYSDHVAHVFGVTLKYVF